MWADTHHLTVRDMSAPGANSPLLCRLHVSSFSGGWRGETMSGAKLLKSVCSKVFVQGNDADMKSIKGSRTNIKTAAMGDSLKLKLTTFNNDGEYCSAYIKQQFACRGGATNTSLCARMLREATNCG